MRPIGAALCLPFFLGLAWGQTPPGAEPARKADTSGWFPSSTPQGTPSAEPSADSLPSFRPDSLKADSFRRLESSPSPFARPRNAQDSADSVAAASRGRTASIAAYAGIAFLDLDAKETFDAALQSRRARDSAVVQQPYEPVHMAFPLGIQALVPVSAHFDLVAKTLSYWYKQTAVLGKAAGSASPAKEEEYFALQANLIGLGFRYYVPPDLLSVTGSLGLFAQGTYFWVLGNTETYTSRGSAPARFDPLGSGYEAQFGFRQTITKPWNLSGTLGYSHQSYASDAEWRVLLADAAPSGKVKWSLNALQITLQIAYSFGLPSSPGAPAALSEASAQIAPANPPSGNGPKD